MQTVFSFTICGLRSSYHDYLPSPGIHNLHRIRWKKCTYKISISRTSRVLSSIGDRWGLYCFVASCISQWTLQLQQQQQQQQRWAEWPHSMKLKLTTGSRMCSTLAVMNWWLGSIKVRWKRLWCVVKLLVFIISTVERGTGLWTHLRASGDFRLGSYGC